MTDYSDGHWQSRDGLTLHYRDYPGPADRAPDRPVVLCLHGLTRNARDFEGLATDLAREWRVICPEMRGRGDSTYASDSSTYTPLQYADDLGQLFAQAGIERVVAIGTSLGGLLTMILAMVDSARIAAAVLNDIGPEVDAGGIARIRGYVGQGRSFPTWMHAARALQESAGDVFPDWATADWLTMAKRCMTLGSNGRIVFDYDMKIAEPFAQEENVAGADLWPGWLALAGRPLLVLRGETSDILTRDTLAQMLAKVPEAEAVTVPRVGHAPTLDEPAARAAIRALLDKVT